MTCKTRIALALAAACLVSTPAFADRDKEKDRDERAERRELRGDRDHAARGGGRAHVNVPPGHLPPPGECRIWFPDRPPGHQPPPGDCRELSRRVPPGAVLVEGG